MQHRFKVGGGECDIGAHHDRYFIALMHCVGETPKSLAIDLFDNQSMNIDRSDKISRERFEDNLKEGRTKSVVKKIEIGGVDCLSFALNPEEPLLAA